MVSAGTGFEKSSYSLQYVQDRLQRRIGMMCAITGWSRDNTPQSDHPPLPDAAVQRAEISTNFESYRVGIPLADILFKHTARMAAATFQPNGKNETGWMAG